MARVLEMHQAEFELAMALSGATSVAQINRALAR